MAPSKRFFGEWNALILFVLGTVALCIGVLSFKDEKALVSPWLTVGFAALLYTASWLLWNKVKDNRWHRRSREPIFTHRNPPAKLPPLREP
jgi:hypothetical protein